MGAPGKHAFAIAMRMAFVCVAIATAAACASAPPSATNADPATASQPSPSDAGVCDASKVQWALGMPGDQATMGRVWRESGAGLFRPLVEGQAPLQDHKPDRVNIHLDANNRIVSIDCG